MERHNNDKLGPYNQYSRPKASMVMIYQILIVNAFVVINKHLFNLKLFRFPVFLDSVILCDQYF